jgi:hypothetical protein
MRRIAFQDLRDRSEAGVAQVVPDGTQQRQRLLAVTVDVRVGCSVGVEQRLGKCDGEGLVWPQGPIVDDRSELAASRGS